MAETKTINDLTDDVIAGKDYRSEGRDKIKGEWIFGWDLENITGGTRLMTLPDGSTRDGAKFVNLRFVRNSSIPNYNEIVSLEKEYENSRYPKCPDRPVNPIPEGKKERMYFVCIVIFQSVLSLLCIFSIISYFLLDVPSFFLIAGIIVGIIVGFFLFLNIPSRKEIKDYKEKYAAYPKEYAAYNVSWDAISKKKTECYEKAKSITEGNDLRQSSLKRSLEAWENRPGR